MIVQLGRAGKMWSREFVQLCTDVLKMENFRFGKTVTPSLVMSVLHLAIFFLLLYGYEYYIVPIYGYEGYYFEPNKGKFIFALGMSFILSLLTPIDNSKPSTLFLHVTLIFVLIPMLVIFYADDKSWVYTLQSVVAYCIILLVLPSLKGKYLRLPSLDNNDLLKVLLLLSALYVVSVFSMGGASYFNLDISKVYDFRTDVDENLAGIFGYISPLIGNVLLPFALLLALILKRYFSALVSIVLSILVFGLTAHKGPLFYPIFVVVIYSLISNKNLIRNFSMIVIVVLSLSILDFLFFDTFVNFLYGWFGSLTMRRMFIVPANINYMYFDFFSVNDFVVWSNSKLTMGLINYPYSMDTSHLIGLEYYNNEATGANTGWLGSGYMHAGFLSIVLYALIISLVFSYIDKLATRVEDRRLVVAGTFVPIITLIISADLPTSFLTHGLFVNLILIGFLKRTEE